MDMQDRVNIEVASSIDTTQYAHNLDSALFDLNDQLNLLSSKADRLDYLVAVGTGVLCALLDILWVGEFNLSRGRDYSSDEVDKFVQRTAKLLGCKADDIKGCVKFLENRFPIPADGNTPDFGGGLQHHLRDFAHHPTIVGLLFSLLTQFTEKSYGTDVNGKFLIVDVPEKSKVFIGENAVSKIVKGTVIWFLHLVSDMAGSISTAGVSGGTGIPGPILSLAKEVSVLPLFQDITVDGKSLSLFLSKLFNGTLLAKYDENGHIMKESVIKFDLRGELGCAAELGRQALPVAANECLVRTFFFIRRLAAEIKEQEIRTLMELKNVNLKKISPINSPTVSRMLTIADGVFTTVDLAEAVATQKYWLSINYAGVGRLAVAINSEIAWALKRQDIRAIKKMYETIKQNTFVAEDSQIYGRIEADMSTEKLGLTLEETEILYNIEYYKTKHDIDASKFTVGTKNLKELKEQWLNEWSQYMKNGFPEFVQVPDAELHWFSFEELRDRIASMNPTGTWYKMVLLEAMLFVPYYPLSTETDKKGKEIPSKKYNKLSAPVVGFDEKLCDQYLENVFSNQYCPDGFISRLRKCHSKVLKELNEALKTRIKVVSVGAGVTLLAVITAGALAPEIAVALVGSNFTGLSGAALTNASLAYLGGGAIAAGGLGMAGGTAVVVGGGTLLGVGVGAGAGGIIAAASLGGKKATIMQSAKLMVSVREIFLNEEKDIAYSTTVYERYVSNIAEIEKYLVELRLKEDVASKEEKKALKDKIKNAEDSANAMKIAMKSMNKYISSYKVALTNEIMKF